MADLKATYLRRGFRLAIADCEYRAPLPPHLARHIVLLALMQVKRIYKYSDIFIKMQVVHCVNFYLSLLYLHSFSLHAIV